MKQEVILQISVNSNPPSQISWEFNGESVAAEKAEQLEDGSLKIPQISMDDAGTWVVIANNDVESIVRKEIFIQVNPERTNITVRACIYNMIALISFITIFLENELPTLFSFARPDDTG